MRTCLTSALAVLLTGSVASNLLGASWSMKSTGLPSAFLGVAALTIDPATPSTLYARSSNGSIFKSKDGGKSWNGANAGLTNSSIRTLVIDPVAPSTLYAVSTGYVFDSSEKSVGEFRLGQFAK